MTATGREVPFAGYVPNIMSSPLCLPSIMHECRPVNTRGDDAQLLHSWAYLQLCLSAYKCGLAKQTATDMTSV